MPCAKWEGVYSITKQITLHGFFNSFVVTLYLLVRGQLFPFFKICFISWIFIYLFMYLRFSAILTGNRNNIRWYFPFRIL